jgi:transposase
MWDNLKSHTVPAIVNEVHNAGHRFVNRPPYRPVDAPIEYFFNQLGMKLHKRMYSVHATGSFVHAVIQSIAEIDGLNEMFIHGGYQ